MQNPLPPPENDDNADMSSQASATPITEEKVTYNYNEFTGEIERIKDSDNKQLKSPPKRTFESYARYSTLGFQMLAAMLIGTFGGLQLDKLLHTKPWLTIIGTLLGVAMAMYIIIKETAKPS